MNRKEANKIIEKHSAAFGALPREAIEAIEYLINAEPCRETDDYENEIADLQNRLDIAEYDKDRFKEKVTVLEEKLKALSAKPCEDCISRQAAKKALEDRFMELQKRHNKDRYETNFCLNTILELPFVTPKQKVGCWIHTDECDEEWQYRCSICNMPSRSNAHRYCSKCGSYMYGIEPDGTGHWIYTKAVLTGEIIWSECSVCGEGEHGCAKRMKFCPNCGAKMVDPQESEEVR